MRLPTLRPSMAAVWLAAAALSACQTMPTKAPDLNAKPEIQETVGAIIMPAGTSYRLVELAAAGVKPKIYAEVSGTGEPGNQKLLFPAHAAASLGLTAEQIQRRFRDTIGKTRRYEVYTSGTSVVADKSDYVVDAQFVSATQELRTQPGGVRFPFTQVQINAILKHRYDDHNAADKSRAEYAVWDAPVEAVGSSGATTGDRITLLPGEAESSAAAQRKLGIDYERAMQRAFDKLAASIDAELRPMGKVIGVDGDGISIVGGLRNGLLRGDEMVVFSAELVAVGARKEFNNMRPLAAVRCNGVGTATSQCDVIRRNPRQQVKVGDYVVLTDHSAANGRSPNPR
jgi:hypothetical protein